MKIANSSVIAILLALCSGSVLASETMRDQTRFKVRIANGSTEVVNVENLEVGQTRTLQSVAGTPVVVGRHEGGYVLDIAGERIEVEAPQVLLSHADAPLLINAGEAGKKVVVKVAKHGQGAQPQRKVVIVKHAGDGSTVVTGSDAQAELEQLLLDDAPLPEGKRVMVTRKVERHSGEAH